MPTGMGGAFWPLDPERKLYVDYGLGFIGICGDAYQYPDPHYDFPLFISRSVGGKSYQIIATIPDPNIDQVGETWESTIEDPEYDTVFKVRITRVAEDYRYKVEFWVSPAYGTLPGGERRWLPPITYPAK